MCFHPILTWAKRRYLKIGAIVAFLLLPVSYFIFYPQYYLSVKDLTNCKIILKIPASIGDNIWIVFINSVEGLPVADHFEIDETRKIIFTETIYQAPYGGYIHQERASNIAPRTTIIADLDIPMDKITFFAGYKSRHLLLVNGRLIPLYDVAHGGDLIEIRVINDPLMVSFTRRIISHD